MQAARFKAPDSIREDVEIIPILFVMPAENVI